LGVLRLSNQVRHSKAFFPSAVGTGSPSRACRMTGKSSSRDRILCSQNTSFAPVSLGQQILHVRSCILVCAELASAAHCRTIRRVVPGSGVGQKRGLAGGQGTRQGSRKSGISTAWRRQRRKTGTVAWHRDPIPETIDGHLSVHRRQSASRRRLDRGSPLIPARSGRFARRLRPDHAQRA